MADRTIVPALAETLRLPVIVSPMFLVSGPDMVIAAAKAGVIGAFPAPNARTIDVLSGWLARMRDELEAAGRPGQWALNMIVHPTYARFDAEIDLASEYKPKIVITALGGPKRVLDRVHAWGGAVFTDVINAEHAKKAVDAGADGLVLVTSGAGGHTGQYSAFAFVDAVRKFWDGPLIVGGAISNGRGVRAMLTLGADFAYMGTRFIATNESLVGDEYRQMVIRAEMADILTSRAITGVAGNWMKESLERSGFDFAKLDTAAKIDFSDLLGEAKAWKTIWSAGQGVGGVTRVQSVAEVVDALCAEYAAEAGRAAELALWPKGI